MHYLNEKYIFLFLVQVFVLLLCARGLGEVFRRWKQPPLTAELLVGIVLGPTLLGRFMPGIQAALFPSDAIQQYMLETVAWLGVLFLLLDTGLEIDFSIAWRQRGRALGIAITDIVTPMTIAFVAVFFIPDTYLVDPSRRIIFSLFMATVMAISAMPVAARCLHDMKLLKTDLGFLAMSALAVNDIIGWVLFAIILGIFTTQTVTIAPILLVFAGTVGFTVLVLTVGRKMSSSLFNTLKERQFPEPATSLTITVLLGLLFGSITQKLGIHALFGFFLAGIVVGEAKSLSEDTRRVIAQMVYSIFVPLFFANIGLKIDFVNNFNLGLVVLISAIGIGGRYLGTWIGVTLTGVPKVNRHLMSITHTPGGMMEIVVALLALETGLIKAPIFVAIVFSAVISSIVMGPWMAHAMARRRRVSSLKFMSEDTVVPDLPEEGRDAAIRMLAEKIASVSHAATADEITALALARETEFGTALGEGIAIPHVRLEHLGTPVLAFGYSVEGIEWDAPDAAPVHSVFFLASAAGAEDLHVQILAQIAKAMSQPKNQALLFDAEGTLELYTALQVVLTPPAKA
jgi:K+:H+ antiporter